MDPFQVVFRQPVFDYEKKSIWSSTLLIPVYLGVVSLTIVLLHLLLLLTPLKKYLVSPRSTSSQPAIYSDHGLLGEIKANIKSNGGFEIWLWKVVRLIGCFALVAISIVTAVIETDDTVHTDGKHWGKKHKHKKKHKHSKFSDYALIQIALAALYAYAGILALCTLTAPKRLRRPVKNHLVLLLLTAWVVYLYRDIWPLGTFTLQPIDPPIWTTWAAIGLLTVTAVIVPLFIPHEYMPVDPGHPSKEPNPEQTASWWSFHVYTFMNPIVHKAAESEHLEYESLPPIADYDTAAYLKKTSFPHMDPTKLSRHRHLFWGLVIHFYKDFLFLGALIVVKVVVGFAGPLGINRLLTYIETNGEGAVVRPWVWITWLFIGPMVGTLAMQWYIFTNTRTLVRIESIIIQLVFEHALRIRMKDDPTPSDKATGGTTAIGTPEPELAATPPNANTTEANGNGHGQPATESTAVVSSIGGPSTSTSTIVKGKGKHKKAPSILSISSSKSTTKDKDKDKEKQENLTGRINNYISTDLGNIIDARDFLFMVWYCPLQIVVCVWFLYRILGVAAFLGMGVLIISVPLPSVVGTILNRVQTERMKRTDARVQAVTEYMNVLRMIKLFAWEAKVKEKVLEKREEELQWTKKRQLLQLLNMNTNYVIPLLVMLVTYSTYTLVFKHELTASRVFSSMAVFDMLRDQLHIVLWQVGSTVQGKVSLDRITEFLNKTELLDEFTEPSGVPFIPVAAPTDPHTIGFRNAMFTWAETLPKTPATPVTPGRRNFRLRIEGELFFRRGAINMIIGPTGAGKTSILMALLGEMHFNPSGPDSWYNLPRAGGVSYATQESWVENETIKNNIIFGSPYDEERYKKVLYQCALEKDLEMFEAGDETEVGEKGLTLSGGQKARVTLARAIYSQSEIVLLDDVLSALDVHTSTWIVDKCFRGDLVKDRTILLVTHNVALVSPVAKYVVSIGLDGRIASQGTLEQALATDSKLAVELKQEKEQIAKQEKVIDKPIDNEKPAPKSTAGKLILAEEVALGRVSWPALKMFLASLGGHVFWVVFIASFVAADVLNVLQTFWLGIWASQYEKHAANEVNVMYYLTVYGGMLLTGMVVYSAGYTVYLFGAISASRRIHDRLMTAILGTTFRWLDLTPVGRIISRFTQDIRAVDGPVAGLLADFVELTITMVVKFIAVVYMTPVFALPGLFVGGLGSWLGNIYIKAQLSVKREMSNAKSPVYSHFNTAIAGLTSIRAYGAQEAFRLRTMQRIDKYTRCARTYYNLNRWVSFRIDLLGALFSVSLASYLIYIRPQSAANVGFSITMAIAFSGMILWWVRIGNEFQVACNSLERIDGYINCDQEPKPTESGKPPAYWPSSGHLVVEKLSASYSADGTQVLNDLSFEIKSGERIGVVGRTGSGKSSLTLSLLRLIPTKGAVMYDGLATEHINLNALRNNITIIPQQPELLSGTLRDNLDPFDEYDDVVLNDALRSAGLENVQPEEEEERITLDTPVSSGGGNFSLGQRQIIALARAICRQSKVLILDEATAAIDHRTDALIQESIRTELKDVTVITVAHRLKTIGDSDKILVLDEGRLVEYDSPVNLLKKESGHFKSLVDQSGEKEELYRMAGINLEHEEKHHHHWNPFSHQSDQKH